MKYSCFNNKKEDRYEEPIDGKWIAFLFILFFIGLGTLC